MTFKELPKFDDRESWLQWRHGGIGSSDAGVIMGVSRFKDRPKLLSEKAGVVPPEDQSNTYIKERGNKIEFQVREFLERKLGKSFAASNTESLGFPFLRASLDGFSEDKKTIVEIKLLSSVNPGNVNTEAEGYKKWLALKNEGTVPKEYVPQLQHQLFVTGADVCFFVGYKEVKGNQIVTEDKLAMVPVYPNRDYTTLLVNECMRFWLGVEFYKRDLIYKEGELE